MELKGSRTEKNLEAVFGGESQARNKYTYFAAVAKGEGFEQIAATFLETAENEKEHAKKEFDFLKGIGDTKANLKAAAKGEHHKWTEMYPEFERVSRQVEMPQLWLCSRGNRSSQEMPSLRLPPELLRAAG